MSHKIYILIVFVFPFWAQSQNLIYPETRKMVQQDHYFDTLIDDHYRWLEDDYSEETNQWVKRQNEFTEAYLQNISYREKIRTRLTALWNYPRQSAPWFAQGYYYFYKNTGKQNQNVLYRRKGIKGIEEMVLDPNFLSVDGTTSIKLFVVSNDGKYAAYGLSKAGSDWTEIKVVDCQTGRDFSETLQWVKFSGISWYQDGFYYSRYDSPDTHKMLSKKNEFHKVYYHKVGTPQSSDQLIYEDATAPLMNFSASVSNDEEYFFISSTKSTSGNNLRVKRTSDKLQDFKIISSSFEFTYTIVDTQGDKIFLLTNSGATRNKLVEFNFKTSEFKTVIEENQDVLISVTRCADKFVCNYMHDASNKLVICSTEGKFEKEIQFPTLCTVNSISGNKKDSLFFYSISSFTFPETVYKYAVASNENSIYFSPAIDFNASEYETRQLFYKSKDGTKIPMFIVMKKGTILNGKNPLLLFGYGGFNISKTPEFITERCLFLENGGIFAMPNLRGGGEYGDSWHKAGTKLQKQNVFDDFIAAAEFLIQNNYTDSTRLAIGGRSNGGLLVGAAMTQRPELFKVALPAVGVMDMLRFHKFTIGWAWTNDYGSSDNADEFKSLLSYSPLHNIKKGVKYPSTLVTTADHDDRVVPAHSFKFISTLQEKQGGVNPVLIRIDVNAGHGSGKPVSKIINEQTDIFSFLLYNLNIEPQY